MEIRITGKGLNVTEGIKDWVHKKASKLEKFSPRLVEAHVIVKKEKYYYIAELTLLGPHLRVYGEGRDGDNIYTAVDTACERVVKQLKKIREKLKSHHQPKRALTRATQEEKE